jgi:uncharacterized protein involved in oxidation of intracellular sulfur
MKVLFVLNDPPYGTERSYNGLRLALNVLKKEPQTDLVVFLMAAAVFCAKKGQNPPPGYYSIDRMLKGVLNRGRVLLCGTCMEARGLADADLSDGCVRSTLDELTTLTLAADKILAF